MAERRGAENRTNLLILKGGRNGHMQFYVQAAPSLSHFYEGKLGIHSHFSEGLKSPEIGNFK